MHTLMKHYMIDDTFRDNVVKYMPDTSIIKCGPIQRIFINVGIPSFIRLYCKNNRGKILEKSNLC